MAQGALMSTRNGWLIVVCIYLYWLVTLAVLVLA